MKASFFYLLAISFFGYTHLSVGQSLSGTHETPAINNPEIQNKITAYQTQNNTEIGAAFSTSDTHFYAGSTSDLATDLVVDADGNYFVCGYFSGEINPGTNSVESNGLHDGFVAKYNSSDELIWFTVLPAEDDHFVKLNSITLDANGSVVVCGTYSGELDLNIDNVQQSTDSQRGFVAIVDENGAIDFNSSFGYSTNNRTQYQVEVFNESIYVLVKSGEKSTVLLKYFKSGGYWQDCLFNKGPLLSKIIVTDFLVHDGFMYIGYYTKSFSSYSKASILKLNSDLEIVWERQIDHKFENGEIGYSELQDIEMDSEGRIIMIGTIGNYGKIGEDVYDTSTGFGAAFSTDGAVLNSGVVNHPSIMYYNNDLKLEAGPNGRLFVFNEKSSIPQLNSYNGNFELEYTRKFIYKVTALDCSDENGIIQVGDDNYSAGISKYNDNHELEKDIKLPGNSIVTEIYSVEHDSEDNVYLFGAVSGTVEIFDQKISEGYFLMKKGRDDEVLWVRNLITEDVMRYSRKEDGDQMLLDESRNNIVLVSKFSKLISYAGEELIISNDSINSAVINIDFSGNINDAWILSKKEVIDDILISKNGELIVSGSFNDILEIGAVETITMGSLDNFIAKFTSSGEFVDLKVLAGTETEYFALIEADDSNNIFFTVETASGILMMNDQHLITPESKGQNTIIGKFDQDLKLIWSKIIGSDKNDETIYEGRTYPRGLRVDSENNFYLKGELGQLAYFDDIKIEISPKGNNQSHHFIAKFDPNGNAVWVEPIKEFGGTNWYGKNGFDIDSDGNIYMAFEGSNPLILADKYEFVPNSEQYIYLVKYTSEGKFNWFKAFEGTWDYSRISSLSVNRFDELAFGGILSYGNLLIKQENWNSKVVKSMFYVELSTFNQLPEFLTEPETLVSKSEMYEYEVQVDDKDEFSVVTIDSEELPDWLSFSVLGEGKALLSGTVPSTDEVSEWNVTISATDGIIEDPVLQTFKLTLMSEILEPEVLTIGDDSGLNAEKSATLFPNPVKNEATIIVDENTSILSLDIFDVAGQLIHSMDRISPNQGSYKLDLSHLKPGLYMINGKTDKAYWNKTFIKE